VTRTFLDSGVLLTAWRGKECCEQALAVMEDESREFCTAQLVKLELLPKPAFFKQKLETEFYGYARRAVERGLGERSHGFGLDLRNCGGGRSKPLRRDSAGRGGIHHFREIWKADVQRSQDKSDLAPFAKKPARPTSRVTPDSD
jgi:hypothetical protein